MSNGNIGSSIGGPSGGVGTQPQVNQPLMPPAGGAGTGYAGPFLTMQTKGFGALPTGAGPLSEAMASMRSAFNWGRPSIGPSSDFGAERAAMGYASQQEEFQRSMQEQQGLQAGQQTQAMQLRNQMLQRLLGLFAGGGAGVSNPWLQGIPTGAVQADPKILAGLQAKVGTEFDRPGGLQSQLQRLGASQGRYTSDSGLAASRQASLDRARSGAMTEAYVPAQQATVQGYQPGLQAAQIYGQQSMTPQFIANLLMQGMGKG